MQKTIRDYYEEKARLVNTLEATYLAKGAVGNLYRYRFKEILNTIRAFIPRKQDCIILDLGCGAGLYLKELEKEGFAIGVDFCKEYLLTAKLYCKSSNLVLADACNLPFRDCMVDFILSSELIEHLFNPDKALKELARVLCKGGKVLVTTPMKYSINEIFGRKSHKHNLEHPNVLTYSQFLFKITDEFHVIFEKAILFLPLTRFIAFLYANQALIRCLDWMLSKIPLLRTLSWCMIVVAVKKG